MNSPFFNSYLNSPDIQQVQSTNIQPNQAISQPFSPLQFSFFNEATSVAQTPLKTQEKQIIATVDQNTNPYTQFYYTEDSQTIFQQKQAFLRSLKYFSKLIENKTTKTTANLAKGLFCSSRECCSLILDFGNRSPYCCKQCQVREQNMRQNRVKARQELIERKRCLLQFLTEIKDNDFERNRLVQLVGVYLTEYQKNFGDDLFCHFSISKSQSYQQQILNQKYYVEILRDEYNVR